MIAGNVALIIKNCSTYQSSQNNVIYSYVHRDIVWLAGLVTNTVVPKRR